MSHDQVLDMLKYLNMSNSPESKVKVIFIPCYLDGNDGILNETYYDLIIGADLSVYPSYYEPWGYTPLESVAFKVPAITTDLAGFGLWVNSLKGHPGTLEDGVKVIHRTGKMRPTLLKRLCGNILYAIIMKHTTWLCAMQKNVANLINKNELIKH